MIATTDAANNIGCRLRVKKLSECSESSSASFPPFSDVVMSLKALFGSGALTADCGRAGSGPTDKVRA